MRRHGPLLLALLLSACSGNKPAPDQPATRGAEPARTDTVFVEAQPNGTVPGAPAPLDPKIAGLFRCWFRDPYEYMFDGSRGQLHLGSRSFGMLMAGINGIFYYGGLNDCAGELVGQPSRSYSDIAPIEALAGVPATLPGDLSFDTVNPAFIAWARASLLPGPEQQIDGVSVQEAYDQVFARFFRLMADSALLLHERYTIDAETKRYLTATDAGSDGLDWLERTYSHELRQHGGDWDGTTMTPAMAMGFWLRRHADGSLPACWHGVRDVLAHYDPQWLAQRRQEFPEGWARLDALADPLAQAQP